MMAILHLLSKEWLWKDILNQIMNDYQLYYYMLSYTFCRGKLSFVLNKTYLLDFSFQ